jgi:hypothetical protein
MQLSTHLITAVMIDKLIDRTGLNGPVKPMVVAVSCFLSHGILDKMAKATYHPPDPLPTRFWEVYHHKILPQITRAVVAVYGPKHWFAMLFSALPDLDWIVRDWSKKNNRKVPGYDGPIMNEGLGKFLDRVPVINQLNKLPDLRFEEKGALVELGLVAVIFTLIQLLSIRKSQ